MHSAVFWLRTLRHRRRRERLLDVAEHLRTLPFRDRLESAELEPAELGAALRPNGKEAEVREEVPGEDCAVHEEALVVRLALGIAVSERLERPRALVPRLADRRQEERLHHPRARRVDEVRAR